MGFLFFYLRKSVDNENNENNKNKGEMFEESLLNKYGECKTYTNFGLKILFITDTQNCFLHLLSFYHLMLFLSLTILLSISTYSCG